MAWGVQPSPRSGSGLPRSTVLVPGPEAQGPWPEAVPRWKVSVPATLLPASWASGEQEGLRAGSRASELPEGALGRELVGVGPGVGFEMLAQVPAIDRGCKEGISLMLLQSFRREYATYPGPCYPAVSPSGREWV